MKQQVMSPSVKKVNFQSEPIFRSRRLVESRMVQVYPLLPTCPQQSGTHKPSKIRTVYISGGHSHDDTITIDVHRPTEGFLKFPFRGSELGMLDPVRTLSPVDIGRSRLIGDFVVPASSNHDVITADRHTTAKSIAETLILITGAELAHLARDCSTADLGLQME